MNKREQFNLVLLENKLSKQKELIEAQDYFIQQFKDELFDRCIRVMDEDWYADSTERISNLKKELGI